MTTDLHDMDARVLQLQAQAENPFDISFLYFIQGRLEEKLTALLDETQKPLLENLLMLYLLIGRAEHDELTGLDAEQLNSIVPAVTKLVEWEV